MAHALRELAYFKAPGYVAFVDALPLTATNKVQRGELKAWARDLPGTSACIDTRHLKRRHMMDYGDVVVCAPVTVPYVRRSEQRRRLVARQRPARS